MGVSKDDVENLAGSKAPASERIGFVSLISDLSARFIGATHGNVDEEIERALA
jgi:hypothetical protein